MALLLSSLNVVLPLFVMMLAGWLVRRVGLVTAPGLAELNRLNVRFFLPVMLFSSVCEGDLLQGTGLTFAAFAVTASVLLFLLIVAAVNRLVEDPRRRCALVLGMYRPNSAIYGLPLAAGILGDAGAVADVLVMTSVLILVTNLLAVVAAELFKGERPRPLALLLRAVKNPIIYGLALGMVAQALPFSLPQLLLSPLRSLAAAATPIAFVVLGATFTLSACKKDARLLAVASAVKLLLTPLAVIPLGILLFDFRGAALVALLCAFATPTAVSALPMVADAGGDGELTSEIIVVTTGLSILTIFGFVYAFKLLGLF
ncbi:MAG: AEC family transporter [Clostridiales bacterium]|nr:AEC family transporter [Clostridiales bacterium]